MIVSPRPPARTSAGLRLGLWAGILLLGSGLRGQCGDSAGWSGVEGEEPPATTPPPAVSRSRIGRVVPPIDLRDAADTAEVDRLAAVVAGRAVAVKETTPIGCPLDVTPRPVIEHGSVEFHRDIEPLLQQHCQQCHHPGDVAPFSLRTFDHAVQRAADIKSYTADRLMPPWPNTRGLPLKESLALEPEEIELFGRWVDEGCPRGDPTDAPPPLVFADSDAWHDSRPPDLVFTMPAAFHLAAQGEDHYRTIVFPAGNEQELYLEKAEFLPGNRRAIDHALAFYDGTGLTLDAQSRLGTSVPRGSGDQDYGPGYESGMGFGFIPDPAKLQRNRDNPGGNFMGWVPGVGALECPREARRVIPPQSDICIQIHYARTGRPNDRPEIDDAFRLGIWLD